MSVRKVFTSLIFSLYGLLLILLAVFAIPQTGWKALHIPTSSMTPTISVGSLAIIHRVPQSSLAVGNIITYTNPRDPSETITHRIVKVIPGNPEKLVTKGDHNPVVDPTIVAGDVVGRMVWHLPEVGNFIGWLHTVPGVVIVIILPGLLLIFYEIWLMSKRLSEVNNLSHAPPTETPVAKAAPASVPPAVTKAKPRPPRRSMDGVGKHVGMLLGVLVLLSLAGGKSYALLASNKVSLTGWSFTTATPTIGGTTTCPPGTISVTIGGTNNNTNNSVDIRQSCQTSTTDNSSTTITNNSTQTSSSGDVSVNGTGTTGNGSSGSSSDSSSTSTQVTTTAF